MRTHFHVGRERTPKRGQQIPTGKAYLGKIDGVDATTSEGGGGSSAHIGFYIFRDSHGWGGL
jgi:hypothetical protein